MREDRITTNSFDTRDQLSVDDTSYEIFRLHRIDGSARLPFSLKVLLENLLRNEDGRLVTAEQVNALAAWDPAAEHGKEVQFTPARVLMQDFTGVPCVVDLVAMRDAMTALGGDPQRITKRAGDRVERLVPHTPLLSPNLMRRRYREQVRLLSRRPFWDIVVWLSGQRQISDLYKRFVIVEGDVDHRTGDLNYENQCRADPRAAREWLNDCLVRDDVDVVAARAEATHHRRPA